MHLCHEELFALMALLPGLSIGIMKAKAWWHAKWGCNHPATKTFSGAGTVELPQAHPAVKESGE